MLVYHSYYLVAVLPDVCDGGGRKWPPADAL
jgi:hypothetical protein